MSSFSIDTFNEILFSAFKDQSPKNMLELLTHEIKMAYSVKIQHMEYVIEDLNNGRPYEKSLELVNNVDSNCDVLQKRIEQLLEEHPELKISEDD